LIIAGALYTLTNLHNLNVASLLNPSVGISHYTKVMEESVEPKLIAVRNEFVIKKSGGFALVSQASEINEVSALLSLDLDSGEVLFERNMQKKLPIASLTKIMTSIVSLDLSDQNELFTVTRRAAAQVPTKIGVVPDQKMQLHELLSALMMTSANDAATVIQDGIDAKYGEEIFINSMNRKAEFLGLKSTSFANPQGFDDVNNYSTLHDLAILSHYALKNYPLLSNIVRKDYQFLPEDSNHKQFDLNNWNGLMGIYPNTIGMKIGSTGDAGKTTIVISERNNKRILAAVLGAEDLFERDLMAAKMLDIGYKKTLNLEKVDITKKQLQKKYASWKTY